MEQYIQKTQQFLYDYLNGTSVSKLEIKELYEHSLRVANIGLELSKSENANYKIVVLACLLHDVGKFDSEMKIDHGRISAIIAKTFLDTLDLTKKEVDDICYMIAIHVDGKCGYEYDDIFEAKIVSDADYVDKFITSKMNCYNDDEMTNREKMYEIHSYLNKIENYLHSEMLETVSGNIKLKEKIRMQIIFYNEKMKELKMTTGPSL